MTFYVLNYCNKLKYAKKYDIIHVGTIKMKYYMKDKDIIKTEAKVISKTEKPISIKDLIFM